MERIYAVKNKLSGRNVNNGLFLYPTDTMASVTLAEQIGKSESLKLEENDLYYLGEYNAETQEIKLESPRVIAWDCRRLKERKLENETVNEAKENLSKS